MKSVLSAIGQTIRRWPLQSALALLVFAVLGQAIYTRSVRHNAERAIRERSVLAADLAAMKGRLSAADADLQRERAAKEALASGKRKAEEEKQAADAARREAEAKLAAGQVATMTKTPSAPPIMPVATQPKAASSQTTPPPTKPSPAPAKPAATPQPIRVTATQLSADYQSNEVAADAKYEGKALEVTGKVKSIDSGMFGSATVILEGSDLFYDVHCTIADTQREKAAKLSKGAQLVVRGKGGSEVIGSPVIDECVLP